MQEASLKAWGKLDTFRVGGDFKSWYASAEFDDTVRLLIERCVPGTTLASQAETEQDLVIAALLRRLRREPARGHRFRPLQLMCEQWADEFEQKVAAG